MAQHFGMKSYMKGAALLTIAALIVKVLSAIYRVPFQNLVGDEGFYIYQQVYPVISIFVVWTSSGFAVAVSKMLADNDSLSNAQEREQRRSAIMRIVFYYLTVLSLLFFVVLFGGAEKIAQWMGDAQLAPLIRTGSFVVWVMPALAILKGGFQSRGMMEPIAYAQVLEQAIRITVILAGTFIIMATTNSLYSAGKMAITGTVIGEVAAFFFLVYLFYRQFGLFHTKQQRQPVSSLSIIKEVTLLSISVSMSGLLLLGYQLVDSFTIYSLLMENGMASTMAKETKGIYDRGQPLVQLGIVIASSLSLAIVPLVAHLSKKQEGRSAVPFIQLTYKAAILFGWAASLGLMLIMPYLNEMLFKTNALSAVLTVYVFQIVPLSIILTFTAILQGYGKLKKPALFLLLGFIIKIVLNLWMIGWLGILGAAIANDIGLLLTASMLIIYLKRLTSIQLASVSFYKKVGIASLSMAIAVLLWLQFTPALLSYYLSSRVTAIIASFTAVCLGAFVLLTMVAKKRVLAEKEWYLLPFGRRMAVYQLWLNSKK
ncbi:polysaccharide biosynthesis protein [Lysinibacillus macroides]|uniref:Membrane protein n=1 Tax=Lysinibacillus macroides TaxID=33935 RepID=A0A0N0UVX9_9BACI|nr:polysaccharide biosynthesis protein [Lysinibacillus macroides]KOY79927.1 membrane protein [Lysinibacillus macroides]QPR67178.1 polysaccharide biosynthesis protein [Lysinibacillus macroides]